MPTPLDISGIGRVAQQVAAQAQQADLRNKMYGPSYAGVIADTRVGAGVTSDRTESVSGAWQAPLTNALLNSDMLLRKFDNTAAYQFATLKEAQAACAKKLAVPMAKRTGPSADGTVGWQIADPAIGGSGVCAGVVKLEQGGFGLMFDPVRVGAPGGLNPDRYSVYPKTCEFGTCSFPMAYHGFQPLKGGELTCAMMQPDPLASDTADVNAVYERRFNPQFSPAGGAVTNDGKEAANFTAAKAKCALDQTCAGVCRQPNPAFAAAEYSDYGTYKKPAAPFTIGTGSSTVYLYTNEAATAWPDMLDRQWDAAPTIGKQPGKNAAIGPPSIGLAGVQVRCAGDAACAGIVQFPDGTYQAVKSLVSGPLDTKGWAISAAIAAPPPPPFVFAPAGAAGSVADARPAQWAAALPGPPANATADSYLSYMKALCAALIPWKARFLLYFNSKQPDETTRLALFGNGLGVCTRNVISRLSGAGIYMQIAQWAGLGAPLPLPVPLPLNKAPGRLIYDMVTSKINVPAGSDEPQRWMILPTESACASKPLPAASK